MDVEDDEDRRRLLRELGLRDLLRTVDDGRRLHRYQIPTLCTIPAAVSACPDLRRRRLRRGRQTLNRRRVCSPRRRPFQLRSE